VPSTPAVHHPVHRPGDLQPVLTERFDAYRRRFQESAPKTLRKLFDDPNGRGPVHVEAGQRQALVKFWNGWHVDLRTVRIVTRRAGAVRSSSKRLSNCRPNTSGLWPASATWGKRTCSTWTGKILESNLFGWT